MADGSWQIRAGARVRVELSLALSAQRFHVALIDPLPAGLEAENPALTERDDHTPTPRIWFDHQSLRDERAEAFAISLPPGEYHYHYIARATTALKAVLAGLDLRNLDEIDAFAGENTTTEFLARHIFDSMRAAIAEGRLGPGSEDLASMKVELAESHVAWAGYEGTL